MAERPAFFTLPPWGYRILTPWLVHLVSADPVRGFLWVDIAAFVLSGPMLFLFLGRLGVRPGLCFAGCLAFGLSPPVGEALRFRFLADPVCVFAEIWFLLALEAHPTIGGLALPAVLGVLAKEQFLYFLPVAYFARRGRDGDRDSLSTAVGAALPALLTFFLLRAWWAPVSPRPSVPLTGETIWLGAKGILAGIGDWWAAPLLGGLTIVALPALLLRRGRVFLSRYGYLGLVAVGIAFAASVYTEDMELVPFFPSDIPRLLLYAVPVVLPLALFAGEAVLPSPPSSAPKPFRSGWGSYALAWALAALPLVTQDRYKRVDLRGPRDGRLVLALCRDSLAFADRLAKGKPVRYEPETRVFRSVGSDPRDLDRMRWFLREGWGPRPWYQDGPVVSTDETASILVPCLLPRDLKLVMFLSAERPGRLEVRLNGHPVGEVSVTDENEAVRIPVQRADLMRGDNLLELAGLPRVRLGELQLNPQVEDVSSLEGLLGGLGYRRTLLEAQDAVSRVHQDVVPLLEAPREDLHGEWVLDEPLKGPL